MDFSTNLPLDSNSEKGNNSFNHKGFNAMIEQFPEWKDFTVDQYFDQFWKFVYTKKLDEVDEKYFWIRFSDYHREEPDIFDPHDLRRRIFAAEYLLLNHMIASFKTSPEQLGEFFRKMLFYTPEYNEIIHGRGNYFDRKQEDTVGYFYSETKKLGIYKDYLRPHLYDLLEDMKAGTSNVNQKAMFILGSYEKEVQSYFIIREYLLNKDFQIRTAAIIAIEKLNKTYPSMDQYRL